MWVKELARVKYKKKIWHRQNKGVGRSICVPISAEQYTRVIEDDAFHHVSFSHFSASPLRYSRTNIYMFFYHSSPWIYSN